MRWPDGRWHGGEGLPFFGHIKDRIVAEAAAAVIFVEDHAAADAPHHKLGTVGIDTGDAGHKLCTPLLCRNTLQIVQQEVHAILIGALAVTGRADARRAVERVHLQTAVVCQCRHTGGLTGGAGFDKGIFLKGTAGFLGIGMDTGLFHGEESPAVGFQNIPDLLQLVGVVGSDHIGVHGLPLIETDGPRQPSGQPPAA